MNFRKFVFFICLYHQRASKQYFYISRICSGSQVKNQNTRVNFHSEFRTSRCSRRPGMRRVDQKSEISKNQQNHAHTNINNCKRVSYHRQTYSNSFETRTMIFFHHSTFFRFWLELLLPDLVGQLHPRNSEWKFALVFWFLTSDPEQIRVI